MNNPALASTGSGVINLDQPGTYLHWSIFSVSLANLVLIAVMVVIFGAALLLPFPGRHRAEPAVIADPAPDGEAAPAEPAVLSEDDRMWTAPARPAAVPTPPP